MRIAALDIGGTSIKGGIWDGRQLWEIKEWDTCAKEGGYALMERVKAILHTYGAFDAVGISTTGQVNTRSKTISYANENVPGYTGMPVGRMLEEEFGVPAAVENDVNSAALGEMNYGAARGLSDFLCLTYGTGVGGAIVINGKIYPGSNYAGGSFGGIVVHPELMRPGVEFSGCYEAFASVTALIQKAVLVNPGLDNGRKIFKAWEREEVRRVIDQWIDEVVYGLVTLIHVFDPPDLILGGGIISQPYIISEIKKRILPLLSPQMRGIGIRNAQLGNQAGMTGAAYLAEKML